MLHNPGPGAYGMMSTYPLNITISYSLDGVALPIVATYSSMGIRYEMEGISDNPALIYEHGLLIRDFGNWNYSEDSIQTLAAEDSSNIFIPIIQGSIDSSSTMEKLTFDELPISQASYSMIRVSSINVTLETDYPTIWANLNPEGNPNFQVVNNTIKITNITGFNGELKLPPAGEVPLVENKLFSGMVTIDTSTTASTIISTNTIISSNTSNTTTIISTNSSNTTTIISTSNTTIITTTLTTTSPWYSPTRGPTGPMGQDMWAANDARFDIPTNKSGGVKQFLIRDIVGTCGTCQLLTFSLIDPYSGNSWDISIKFKNLNSAPQIQYIEEVGTQYYPEFANIMLSNLNGEINLTSRYINASNNINIPNKLTITAIDSNIKYVNFVIN